MYIVYYFKIFVYVIMINKVYVFSSYVLLCIFLIRINKNIVLYEEVYILL